jgi:hypothetical protein
MAARKKATPRKATKRKRAAFETQSAVQRTRFWLMYPPRFITRPVIWELGRKFPLVTNVRQASVTDEIGIVCLEVEGERVQIKAAVKWLEGLGVRVEPVEINVIES